MKTNTTIQCARQKRDGGEADNFAIEWTLSKEEQEEILKRFRITEDDVIEFAKKFNIHPSIIIGQWQHEGLVPYLLGRHFFEPVEFE